MNKLKPKAIDKLIEAYILGNDSAFTKIHDDISSMVYNRVLTKVNFNEAVAEEIPSQTFEKVVFILKNGNYKKGNFLGWCYTISANLAMDYHRARHKNPASTLNTVVNNDGEDYMDSVVKDSQESVEDVIAQSETVQQVLSYVQRLPESQRDIIDYRIFKKWRFKDIAEEKGISINTCIGRMRYALGNLRKMIEEDNNTSYNDKKRINDTIDEIKPPRRGRKPAEKKIENKKVKSKEMKSKTPEKMYVLSESIKEKLEGIISEEHLNAVQPIEKWKESNFFTHHLIDTLEEVPARIKLVAGDNHECIKMENPYSWGVFSEQQLEVMEKGVNNELIDLESIDRLELVTVCNEIGDGDVEIIAAHVSQIFKILPKLNKAIDVKA